jgi:hypothetical protein
MLAPDPRGCKVFNYTIIYLRTTLLQVGPELEVPGYGCEDHFLELDTVDHSWEALAVRRAWPAGWLAGWMALE